jgi:DNA polymerase-3 subunit gamma/tau
LIARHADGGMRDALSVLDQCLSFGEGAVTSARVREVLGLVADELYAEVLAIVAERRPEGVFPLIDRLVNAGADLAEFMAGAGEALRALLLRQLGQEPVGLTESLRQALEAERDRLEPGDVLRMLRLLAESETAIRRSVNPRLIVETLLLRWAMMDRTVDLAQVLGSEPAGASRGPASGRGAPRSPAPPPGEPRPPRLSVAPPPKGGSQESTSDGLRGSAGDAPPATGSSPMLGEVGALAVDTIPPTLDAVRMAWGDLVAEVRRRSRFLGEALSHTAPSALALPWLTVELSQPNPLVAERLQAQAQAVEEVVAGALGQPVRLRVTDSAAEGSAPPSRPQRITEASLKADRLRSFRAKDPALDTAADALDLEIVD